MGPTQLKTHREEPVPVEAVPVPLDAEPASVEAEPVDQMDIPVEVKLRRVNAGNCSCIAEASRRNWNLFRGGQFRMHGYGTRLQH